MYYSSQQLTETIGLSFGHNNVATLFPILHTPSSIITFNVSISHRIGMYHVWCACVYVCVFVHMTVYVCLCECMCVSMCVCVYVVYVYVCLCICVCMYVYVRVCVHVSMCVCVYVVCVRACIYPLVNNVLLLYNICIYM